MMKSRSMVIAVACYFYDWCNLCTMDQIAHKRRMKSFSAPVFFLFPFIHALINLLNQQLCVAGSSLPLAVSHKWLGSLPIVWFLFSFGSPIRSLMKCLQTFALVLAWYEPAMGLHSINHEHQPTPKPCKYFLSFFNSLGLHFSLAL